MNRLGDQGTLLQQFVDDNLLGKVSIEYLTRNISSKRKFDIVTFSYFAESPSDYEKRELAIAKKQHSNRHLPPTLDAILPKYLIVFVDVVGIVRACTRRTLCGIDWNEQQ